MKRMAVMILTFCLMLCVCLLPVSANAPGVAEFGEGTANPVAIILFLLVSLYGIILTVVLEWLLCKPFGIGKEYKKLIVWTNIATQLVLRILQLFTLTLQPEGISWFVWNLIYVTVLEILVYLVEFLIYNRTIKKISWKKCLLYTVTANTASLLCGLLLLKKILGA